MASEDSKPTYDHVYDLIINRSWTEASRRWEEYPGPVNKGVYDNYFDYQLTTELKHRLLDRVNLTVNRRRLTAGGSPLNEITGGILQGFITNEYPR